MTRPVFDDTQSILTPPHPRPASFLVVVRPRPPQKYHGVIARAKRSINAERAMATIGTVLAIGPLAWSVKAGDLDPNLDPVSKGIVVGTWVQFRQYSGQRLRIRRDHVQETEDTAADEYIITLSDSDILSVFVDEADAARFYDYE